MPGRHSATSPPPTDWAQSTIASGDLADEIGALKREPGKDRSRGEVPPSRSRSPGSAWSANTGSCFSRWRWATGARCSRGSPRPSCSTSLRPGQMPTARYSMSAARLPDEQFRMIEAGEVGADVAVADFTFAGAAEAGHRVPGLLPAVHVMRTSLRSRTYSSTWSGASAPADSAARRLTTAVRRSAGTLVGASFPIAAARTAPRQVGDQPRQR